MSLKSNIAANYASQIYSTLIGIALVPLYLAYMGAESYGLVGFFAMLQAWFNLLDLGLTPTIARESARYVGGAMSPVSFHRLFRSLSIVFVCIAVVGGTLLIASARSLAEQWLNIQDLVVADVIAALRIMAVCVALRWMGGLYRGVITGAERLVWLSIFNALVATLRFAGVLVSMSVWGYTATVFFYHQMVVAVLELVILYLVCSDLIPSKRDHQQSVGWSFRPIQSLLRFSLTIAFTSSVWVLVTQSDKLILSGILPLEEYGYFTLAVLVAGGITVMTGPVSIALMPRLARLHAEGDTKELRRLYNRTAQFVSVVAGTSAIVLAVCSESLLFAWTGSSEIVKSSAPILRLYAVGNGMLALAAFPYYLQYARGNLRYHFIGNILMVVLLVPVLVMAAIKAGGVGAGWAWVAMNALYLFGWAGYSHAKLEPGLHVSWIMNNVLKIVLPTLFVGLLLGQIVTEMSSRFVELLFTCTVASACFLVAAFASPLFRTEIRRIVSRARQYALQR